MLFSILKKWLVLIAVVFLGAYLFQYGCGGNPATAPSFPTEIPTPATLKFVSFQGLQVDLTTISGAPLAADSSAPIKTVVDPATISGDKLLKNIQFGPNFFNEFFNNFFAGALNGIQELNIPINELNKGCKEDIKFSVASGFLAGQHKVALDFSPFDYNNDRSLEDENCSGNSTFEDNTKSVCIRFWADGAPFIAGVFDVAPVYSTDPVIPDTLGKGRFKLFIAELENFVFLTEYEYAQPADLAQKDIAYFFKINPHTGFTPDDLLFTFWNGHSSLSQVGPNDTAFKSVNFSTQIGKFLGDFFGDLDMKYIGQFVQGVDLWGGALDIFADNAVGTPEFPDGRVELSGTCAVASTGVVVDSTQCQDVGGNHVNILPAAPPPFITSLQNSDVALPNGFVGSSPSFTLPTCDTYR